MNPKAFQAKLLACAIGYERAGISRKESADQVSAFLALFSLPFADGGVPVAYCAAGASFCACKAWAFCAPSPLPAGRHDLPRYLSAISKAFVTLSPRCSDIVRDAAKRQIWMQRYEAEDEPIQPGSLVFFNWSKQPQALESNGKIVRHTDGKVVLVPQHIEIVESVAPEGVQTIGFNVSSAHNSNGGAVSRKSRSWSQITGVIDLTRFYPS